MFVPKRTKHYQHSGVEKFPAGNIEPPPISLAEMAIEGWNRWKREEEEEEDTFLTSKIRDRSSAYSRVIRLFWHRCVIIRALREGGGKEEGVVMRVKREGERGKIPNFSIDFQPFHRTLLPPSSTIVVPTIDIREK